MEENGVLAIAPLLSAGRFPILEELNLMGCKMTDAGAITLAQALPCVTKLSVLDVSCNDIRLAGVIELVRAAQCSLPCQLTQLHMQGNPIATTALASVAQSLVHLPVLQVLDVQVGCPTPGRSLYDGGSSVCARLAGAATSDYWQLRLTDSILPNLIDELACLHTLPHLEGAGVSGLVLPLALQVSGLHTMEWQQACRGVGMGSTGCTLLAGTPLNNTPGGVGFLCLEVWLREFAWTRRHHLVAFVDARKAALAQTDCSAV
jgi:hypothetical protein